VKVTAAAGLFVVLVTTICDIGCHSSHALDASDHEANQAGVDLLTTLEQLQGDSTDAPLRRDTVIGLRAYGRAIDAGKARWQQIIRHQPANFPHALSDGELLCLFVSTSQFQIKETDPLVKAVHVEAIHRSTPQWKSLLIWREWQGIELLSDGDLQKVWPLSEPTNGEASEINRQSLLTELLSRGGHKWIEFLKQAITNQISSPNSDDRPGVNLETLMVLRRLEGRPDPVRVVLFERPPVECVYPNLPVLHVFLENCDDEKYTIGYKRGGDNRSGRQARWRVCVIRDDGSTVAERPRLSQIGGGVYTFSELEYGKQSDMVTLNVSLFVASLDRGHYKCQILYSDREPIADIEDWAGRILARSEVFDIDIK
jgi:hypothetical protein